MVAVPKTGIQDIDGVLWGYKWDTLNLTYSFPTSTAEYNGYNTLNTFEAFNATQQTFASYAIGLINQYSGLNITFTNQPGANFRFAEVTTLRYTTSDSLHQPGFSQPGAPSSSAEGNPPDPTQIPAFAQGDMWFNHTNYNTPTLGSFSFGAGIAHELGHAVGLKHGHNPQDSFNGTANVNFPTLPPDHDSQEYSVMTYNSYPRHLPNNASTVNYPQTYMMDDIVALQYMYGADFSTNSGNTTYSFSPTTGEMFINGVGQGAPATNYIFRTIWDGGGTDTYDFSNYSTNVSSNLLPASYSTPSSAQRANLEDGVFARGSIFNTYQNGASLIENVTTGSGNDAVVGNEANNVIILNGGNDGAYGGGGNDTILGGAGTDTLLGESGNDAINGGLDPDFILCGDGDDVAFGGGGTDNILGEGGNDVLWGEDDVGAVGANDGLDGGSGNDTILGQGGNDTIFGGSGYDAINGGDGNDALYGNGEADVIFGGNGGDLIYGGAGGDVLKGEAGADLFCFTPGDGGDGILDFNFGGTRDGIDLRQMFSQAGNPVANPRAAGQLAVYQNGADADLYVYGVFTARIYNVTAAALDDSYFLF